MYLLVLCVACLCVCLSHVSVGTCVSVHVCLMCVLMHVCLVYVSFYMCCLSVCVVANPLWGTGAFICRTVCVPQNPNEKMPGPHSGAGAVAGEGT